MTEKPDTPQARSDPCQDAKTAREEALAKALRANLRRRKAPKPGEPRKG